MEVNLKAREAGLIRECEKDEVKLFFSNYILPFSFGDKGKGWKNLYFLQIGPFFDSSRPYVTNMGRILHDVS
jgi:hypothetical protein